MMTLHTHITPLDITGIAAYLKVHPDTVRQLVADGKLAGKKMGSGPNSPIRISTVSIEKFMES